MQQHNGYYRFPTIWKDKIAFVAEDDLWITTTAAGVAQRLTKSKGKIAHPRFSPDGRWIAYIATEEGVPDVYVMPAEGGEPRRLTFWGAAWVFLGWSPDSSQVIFASNAWQPFRQMVKLYAIGLEGGDPVELPYGLAFSIAYEPGGKGVLIGRNTTDYARWKRYRGGTVGVLWIDRKGSGQFTRLLPDLTGNLTAPMWIGKRIYFLSDHEGIGNLYSCTPQGEDLRRHTHHTEFYARNASTDGHRIVYHAGGDLYVFDPETDTTQQVPVEIRSPREARQRKFVSPTKFFERFTPHPEGHSLCVTIRGKTFLFPNWEGAVLQLGKTQGVRYRLCSWMPDKQHLLTVSDETGEEMLELYHLDDLTTPKKRYPKLDIGHPLEMAISPRRNFAAITNHRNELLLINLDTGRSKVIDRSEYAVLQGIDWSPDGQWLTYSIAETPHTFSIKLYNVKTRKKHLVTQPRFRDIQPTFDPQGRYLYFLSYREFNPVYDSLYFDLGFPKGARPYLIMLQKDAPSPFDKEPRLVTAARPQPQSKAKGKQSKDTAKQDTVPSVHIDFEGIEQRIRQFPVPENRYVDIQGTAEAVFLLSVSPTGSLEQQATGGELGMYHFQKRRYITLAQDVQVFSLSADRQHLAYQTKDNRLRVVKVATAVNTEKLPDSTAYTEEGGWINLGRIRVEVDPAAEYRQILREVWRLQREHFWTADMGGIDWEAIYQRYAPLLDRITTRDELSDLIWELQGELGTSHAYEFGGDYPVPPQYLPGFLGADIQFDPKVQAYRITKVYQGDPWKEDSSSPLARFGSQIREGDLLLAINGRKLSKQHPPCEALINHAHDEIAITVARSKRHKKRTFVIRTLRSERLARYRDWVEHNRAYVRAKTKGRVGYVHIPDMGPHGFAEFHRYFLQESAAEALIVDVRYNGGGHVSQLILEKLLRRPLAFIFRRWGSPEPYPSYALSGPIVAITNEYAGSDGDIFSHSFKMLRLGKLIGKRTWGGVVGISPRYRLVDGTLTTQPEFSFWFTDVEWQIENHGTEPDIEVEITPQDWARGKDPQLDKAIAVVLQELKHFPVARPRFTYRPQLAAPQTLRKPRSTA